jgi:FtsH-binding integral membrane protein
MMLPIAVIGGPIVAQAATATGLMVGGISAVAAVAPNDSFLWMRGGLTIGLMTVVGASLGQMFFPASTLLMNVSLYGGLALFGGFQLYDTQQIAKRARELPPTVRYDGLGESIRLYQNTLNIFIRFVQIFAQQQNSQTPMRRAVLCRTTKRITMINKFSLQIYQSNQAGVQDGSVRNFCSLDSKRVTM